MKHLLPFLLIVLCVSSCGTQKQVQKDVSAATDSVVTAEHHRTIAVSDSIIKNLHFEFDTLTITVERPVLVEGQAIRPTEIVRLKAVGGKLNDTRRQHKVAVEAKSRLDSTAYKANSADKSAEHTATTVAYEPPNTTSFLLFVALILGLLAYYFLHRRK
ncbi:MAG: hypothetical protein ACI4US_05225 [Muribaculaceae bacterium]